MNPSGHSDRSGGALRAIVVAVVIAFVAGGTSPWWWKVLFPPPEEGKRGSAGLDNAPKISLTPDPFFLSDNPRLISNPTNVHGNLQLRRVYWQSEVWIDGLRYEHAIGMAAPDNGVGYADFKIPPGSNFFQTVFGFARDDNNPDQYGNAVGRIYLDGDPVWEGGVFSAFALHTPSIPIPPGSKSLRLEVDSKGTNQSDQTTWGDPNFTSAK